ncbi:MAG: phosphotransferase, partial [Defluviitaleaceae bacterium]|nr:phosphotransferase [Defluviitaleaceae bacterium]
MDYDFEEIYGRIVGRGAQATVYAKGDYAVKLYREGYPKANVFSEAYIMANLEHENFPSPKVYEVLQTGGRYGLRMDLVKGRSMSEIMNEAANDTEKQKSMLDELVNLQCR